MRHRHDSSEKWVETPSFSTGLYWIWAPLSPWGCLIRCTFVLHLQIRQLPIQILQPCTHNGFA
jgi:hypothetical protein